MFYVFIIYLIGVILNTLAVSLPDCPFYCRLLEYLIVILHLCLIFFKNMLVHFLSLVLDSCSYKVFIV